MLRAWKRLGHHGIPRCSNISSRGRMFVNVVSSGLDSWGYCYTKSRIACGTQRLSIAPSTLTQRWSRAPRTQRSSIAPSIQRSSIAPNTERSTIARPKQRSSIASTTQLSSITTTKRRASIASTSLRSRIAPSHQRSSIALTWRRICRPSMTDAPTTINK